MNLGTALLGPGVAITRDGVEQRLDVRDGRPIEPSKIRQECLSGSVLIVSDGVYQAPLMRLLG